MSDAEAVYDALREEIGTVLVGNEDIVEQLTVSLLTRGHVLLEGVPGVAKTTAANLYAEATGLTYKRIQMTPDILPADITGTQVYREPTGEFELQRGPIFGNIVVADEINRATPKAQSALLEAMQENHVTIDGETLPLPDPFMVIATQNPIEMEGTFELPEAQRDRFQFKLIVETPNQDDERQLLDRFDAEPTLDADRIQQVVDEERIRSLRDQVTEQYVDDSVKEYILGIVEATRSSPDIDVGASPRATLTLMDAGKARAAIHGRGYVIPDDIKQLAKPVLRHRLILSTDAELTDRSADAVIESILQSVPATEPDDASAHPREDEIPSSAE
ncbi:ATPase associated with various cellular activities AAA_3 [Halorhabdus utahensis DSM 12940]|uniref:ATPase associated with various cellular activities AAA_3 n=1 Tax=Halorhabdus utahensis (strain DSM 12940 / JCM 11049 / AX-2) TaxID=519442 RepID=C7NM63_HALUD|nr:MoxR family ATPase [Halorhabdus utahensis]ACV11271.1 ATPase associated with various cellular activities AAA_3 [Halorhabdus utahensis DSM 12940]